MTTIDTTCMQLTSLQMQSIIKSMEPDDVVFVLLKSSHDTQEFILNNMANSRMMELAREEMTFIKKDLSEDEINEEFDKSLINWSKVVQEILHHEKSDSN